MRGIVDQVHHKGAELVVIGNGSVDQARKFAAEQGMVTPLLTDPSRRSYQAAGFNRPLLGIFKLSVLRRGWKALRQGFHQTSTQGDALQLGGALVFDKGGQERFAFIATGAGEHPEPEQLLAALG